MSGRLSAFGLLLALGTLILVSIGLAIRQRLLRAELAELQSAAQSRSLGLQTSGGGEASGIPVPPTARTAARAELAQARLQVVALETRARIRRMRMLEEAVRRQAKDAADLASENRDPERGLTKLEYFRDVGRATPEAALQTLVWAALTGNEQTLAAGFALDGRALERAAVVLSNWPADAADRPTPEELAGLWFQDAVLDAPAVHIEGKRVIDDTHVVLLVRGGIGTSREIPMTPGPSGWQLNVTERAMEFVQQRVLGSSPPLPEANSRP